ncbi:MAG: DUF1302 domain-containing protein [Thermoanaerobaculia bacterium]|nr:DUF1302 domain-containing protein [Thermoanaerobaculia bacterium]
MSRVRGSKLIPKALHRGGIALTALLALAVGFPGEAADLSSGNYTLNVDTTISWGTRVRVAATDQSIVGLTNGGTAYSVNGDDGNLNFDTGLNSNALKATLDIDFAYKNAGVFLRGTGFYDYELEENNRARTPLTEDALDWVGSRAELLDAFVWYKFNVGSRAAQVRAGKQVLNWGESTFIGGGLSSINPIDVAAIRVPGAELREAFRPSGVVWGSMDLSNSVSLQAFYQYDWESTVIDPPGTYFSSSDFAGPGGSHVFLGFGSAADIGPSPAFIQPPLNRPFLAVSRTTDDEPDDGGQYGLTVRWFADSLGGTEFGLYYVNYHSRLPVVNAITGTVQGAQAAAVAGPRAAGVVYAAAGVKPGQSPQVDALAAAAGQAAATDAYAATARYFLAYPEDITMYGISWNSQLGTSGIAFQGEVSYQQDKPFLVDDVELLFASLSPISPGLAATNQVAPGGVGFATRVDGFRRLDATQFQFTLTKVLGQFAGADQATFLIEPAITHVSGMPDKSVLRFEAPGTYTSGNPIHAGPGGAHAGKAFEPEDAFADPTSWGYQFAARLDYNNAVGAFNLSPRFAWQHDVDGVSPGPGGNFIEGRYAATVGLAANYQNQWEFDLSYTNFGGANRYNLINDRDFLAGVVKFSY